MYKRDNSKPKCDFCQLPLKKASCAVFTSEEQKRLSGQFITMGRQARKMFQK